MCEGRQFRWVEEFFFHKKAELFDDQAAAERLMRADSPAECKRIGRSINCDQQKWREVEVPIMKQALQEKFTQNPNLKDFLLKTKDLHLAEASPTDKFWGTGVGLGKEEVTSPAKWGGQNKLGELLMSLRSELQ